VRADTKQTGTRWPSRSAFSKGACSCSGRQLLALLQVELHQRLVHLHHLVDQRIVRTLDVAEIGGVGHRVEVAVAHAPVGRQVDGQALGAEAFLDLREHRGAIDAGRVDPVDHDEAVEAARPRRREQPLGGAFDAGGGVDDDERGLHRRQHRQRAAQQVRIAGRIEQGDCVAGVLAVAERHLERVAQLAFEGVGAADRGAALDAAWRRDRAHLAEEPLGERGLAAAGSTGQGQVTDAMDAGDRHVRASHGRGHAAPHRRPAPETPTARRSP
jgi:hypothetical protein